MHEQAYPSYFIHLPATHSSPHTVLERPMPHHLTEARKKHNEKIC